MKESNQRTQTLAVIVGNREFFPDQLAEEGGKKVIKALKDLGFTVVAFSEGSKSVQTRGESKKCARVLKENADDIDGVVVTLPNFGDEKGIAETLRLANLDVPVLVHAFPDELGKMDITHRRDSFCGKFSVCNNLYQYGITFTNTQEHVEAVNSQEFKEDLLLFGSICKTVKGLKNARLGAVGVRPNAFKTVRYSAEIAENDIDALSFNCWPAIEKYYNIVPCAAMSFVSERLIPTACETDVMGSLTMLALQLASEKPAALVDLNNNYGDDLNKCVLFHCSAVAQSFFTESPVFSCHDMQDFYGSLSGKMAPGPVTLFRLSTDDVKGCVRGYLAEGRITEDEIETFGTYGVVEVEGLQSLLAYVADSGFEHHVAIVRDHVADVLEEAVRKYVGWEVYRHSSSKVK